MLYRNLRFAMHQALNQRWPHWDVYRITTDRWHRHWQCEWDGCTKAVRAFTSWGALAKAMRHAVKEAKQKDAA